MKPLIKAIRPASFKQKQSLEALRAGRHTAQLDAVLINTRCSFAMKCTHKVLILETSEVCLKE